MADFFASFIKSLPGGFAEGIMWGILAIAVFITYRVLDFADLTVEGSIALGGSVTASLIFNGFDPLLATLIATCSGLLAGLITGLLHTKLKIPPILSGILTMLMLYSINLRIMGKANIGLGQQSTVITVITELFNITGRANAWSSLIVGIVTVVLVIVGLYWFFGTEIGSAIRSTGDNKQMSKAQGINTDFTVILGLTISNGLVALAGAIIAQSQGYADVSMGVGAIVIGLAAVIIGEIIFGKKPLNFAVKLLAVVIGSIVYRMIIVIALLLGMPSNDMKLATAIIVVIALTIPNLTDKLSLIKNKQKNKKKLDEKNLNTDKEKASSNNGQGEN